ncbi:PDDEXK nuclease domain-containing protein [Marinobacteraceae bacterium S3BR75-40.1]
MAEPPSRPERPVLEQRLLTDIWQLVTEARARAVRTVNTELTLLYWRIGQRLQSEALGGDRAEYGERILATLSQQLTQEFGRGFDYTALTRMVKFHQAFPDKATVGELAQALSWSHFRELLPLERPLQRDFYAELCRVERWSVRTLRQKIDSMLYERTALSRQPEAVARQELQALRDGEQVSPDLVLRDPYVLEFLGLKDRYLERDLEDAILRDMEAFLMELGAGFAFLGRQHRISIDGDDFYLDLLFYNRLLKRLVAIELKLGDFKPAYKGQMELYLRWLDKHERQPGEAPPLGLILCAGKRREQIELLELDQAGIHVAEYLTALPPKAVLREKLHQAIEQSRQRLGGSADGADDGGD